MSISAFNPTPEQQAIIEHDGSAFIEACPGAGKTRVMVERARRAVSQQREAPGRGLAFLSFTEAAVSELEARLYREGVVQKPAFPHFIGTFDSFLWKFLIAPFGAPCERSPARLIPDKKYLEIGPPNAARTLPLECFDRVTGRAIEEELKKRGFDRSAKSYETIAIALRTSLLEQGHLDFEDARELALNPLKDPSRSHVLVTAFAARFTEIIVDEAQDCNALDLEIIDWMRRSGITVKVICDPNQAIYGFRGGVGTELARLGESFPPSERLPMTGNFRSGKNIAKSILALRAPSMRGSEDEALGEHRHEPSPVHVLAYGGNGVPRSVGVKFGKLVEALDLNPANCPIVASTLPSACKAAGVVSASKDGALSVRLATTVHAYHAASDMRVKKDALVGFHKIQLELADELTDKTYQQYLLEHEIESDHWRPRAIAMLDAMRFDRSRHASASEWLRQAKTLLEPLRKPDASRSISQRLPDKEELGRVFTETDGLRQPAHTIHAVKGLEFDAICVVMTSRHAGSIIDFLSSPPGGEDNESARKIYVGASRARRLLSIATPKSQAERLRELLLETGADVELTRV